MTPSLVGDQDPTSSSGPLAGEQLQQSTVVDQALPAGSSVPISITTNVDADSAATDDNSHPMTHLSRGIHKPKIYTDGTIRYAHTVIASEEPCNLQDALSSPCWKEAMDAEFDAFMKNKTWHLVPPRKQKNVIDCKWVYKVKCKADGTIDRYKPVLFQRGSNNVMA